MTYMSRPKILLFGAGGVGSVYVYILDKGGAEVTAVCRSNYAAAKANGLSIDSKIFGKVNVKPHVVQSVAEATGLWEYIVVCSKAFPGQPKSAANLIKPAVGPSTTIVIAQNGIGLEEEYRALYPENAILSGVVYLPAEQERPGVISMGDLELLEIGTYPHDAAPAAKNAANDFAAIFEAAGATCKLYDDIQVRRWAKLAVNASWNPICALSASDDANFLRASQGAMDMVRKVMLEIIDVAHALGYDIPRDEEVEWQLARAIARLKTGGKEPSMLTDVRNGRRIEVEAIIGNAVRFARRLGVDTPLLDLLYALARGLDESIARQQGAMKQ